MFAVAAARYTAIMSNIAELDHHLNQLILSGKAMDGLERFYAEDCTMQENSEPPCVGKAANRKREEEFFKTIEAWHDGKVVSSAAHGDTSFSQWEMDVSIKGAGRVKIEQVAVRQWKDGKVVHERFFHK